jgi:diguanylate cyclase (GGDEF)-like protein
MHLDTLTLLATITIAYFAGAVMLGVLAISLRSLPGHIRKSWTLWSGAMVLSGTCAILIGLRGTVPDILSIPVANALLLIGFGIRPNALSMLNGRGIAYPWLPVLAAVIWLGFYLFPWFRDELNLRVLFVNGLCVLAMLLCIRESWPQKKEMPFSSWLLMSVFGADVLIRLSVVAIYFNSEFQSLKDAFQTPEFTIILVALLFTIVFKVVGLCVAVFEQMKQRFQQQALRDSITGLLNHRSFIETAEIELTRHTDSIEPFALVTLEIDELQSITARYSPSMGDALLRLQGQICSETIDAQAIVGRIRDNQFAMFLPGTNKAEAGALANTISRTLTKEGTRASGHRMAITVSTGVYCGNAQIPITRALEIADRCLARAKSAGGNQVLVQSGQDGVPLRIEAAPSPFAPRRHFAA